MIPMTMPTITDDDLEHVDLSKPLPIEDSVVFRDDPEKARLLLAKMGNPLEVQQRTAAEFKTLCDKLIEHDTATLGRPSDATMKWINESTKQLSELHKNMYGTKSMQVSVQGKVTHAQIASLMRQAKEEGRVVDVTPEERKGDEHGKTTE